MYVSWVIEESRKTKQEESVRAYTFIDDQVVAYHEKLIEAERGLEEYRSRNMDALPESSAEVLERSIELRREIEALPLSRLMQKVLALVDANSP